jgi:uncharacterized membrane protein YeaQ/YmgE (transglycosylase-associated protein family)
MFARILCCHSRKPAWSLCGRVAIWRSRPPAPGLAHGYLSWIILGLIAGFIGSKIVDKQGQGFWLDIALGIVGALVGGFLFDLFGASGVTGLNIYSMIVAIVGSIVVLLIYNALIGRRALDALIGTDNCRPSCPGMANRGSRFTTIRTKE